MWNHHDQPRSFDLSDFKTEAFCADSFTFAQTDLDLTDVAELRILFMEPTMIEFALRGGATTLCLVLSLQWWLQRHSAGFIFYGALFMFAVSGHSLVGFCLISSNQVSTALGWIYPPLAFFSMLAPVFFWWFALSLFDDQFQWRWLYALPCAEIGFRFCSGYFAPDRTLNELSILTHTLTLMALWFHVLYMLFRDWSSDMLDTRRTLRAIIVAVVPAIGLLIMGVELLLHAQLIARPLTQIHAVILIGCAVALSIWGSKPRIELFHQDSSPGTTKPTEETNNYTSDDLSISDHLELQRLQELMHQGLYKTESLTMKTLAEEINIPEHRLRKLINRGLGFKNFRAYLNALRIPEAQNILSDPTNVRVHIATLAFDLGFGSIASFNRAFKAATGQTPTRFRTEQLKKNN